ncbi:hypothetical protein A9W95_18235 [Mycobacterium sp. 1423905.2]|nr:hypothetical protein A9W95_18235 [Mycobacterium sp. 1423905.2]
MAAAVAEAGDVTDQYLIRAERMAVRAMSRAQLIHLPSVARTYLRRLTCAQRKRVESVTREI